MPSRLSQMRATSGALRVVSANPGCAAAARSTNRRTDSACMSSAGDPAPPGSGSVSDGTRQTISPVTCSGSRLVASTWSSGQPRSSASLRWAQAATRWSQLSSTIRASYDASAASSASTVPAPRPGLRPSAAASVSAITSGCETGASSTSQTPSRKSSRRRAATSRPSRVLPQPAGPAIVTSGPRRRRRASSSSSFSRPTKVVSSTGRLSRRPAAAAPGTGAARAATAVSSSCRPSSSARTGSAHAS